MLCIHPKKLLHMVFINVIYGILAWNLSTLLVLRSEYFRISRSISSLQMPWVCVARPSAGMILAMQGELILVFHEDVFQQPVPYQYREMICTYRFMFLPSNTARTELINHIRDQLKHRILRQWFMRWYFYTTTYSEGSLSVVLLKQGLQWLIQYGVFRFIVVPYNYKLNYYLYERGSSENMGFVTNYSRVITRSNIVRYCINCVHAHWQ